MVSGDLCQRARRGHRRRCRAPAPRPPPAFNARIPIYQGGLPAARIRQAQALEGQSLEQVRRDRARGGRDHPLGLRHLPGGAEAIQSNEVAVTANELALEGARAEHSVGTRTVLDVLNAEQELLNAQVALVTARRDAYVAGFQLLNAMGQAEADDLGLDGGPLYDPLGNYRRVAGSVNDWASDPRHQPVAHPHRRLRPRRSPHGPRGVTDRRNRQYPRNAALGREPSMEDILASIKR